MRQSGRPFFTQSQVARVCRTAGSTWGLASNSKVRSDLSLGNAAALIRRSERRRAVVALGHQQLGEEPAVGHLLAGGGLGHLGEPGADRGQPQHPAGLVDRGIGGLLGQSAPAHCAHQVVPSPAPCAVAQQLVIDRD